MRHRLAPTTASAAFGAAHDSLAKEPWLSDAVHRYVSAARVGALVIAFVVSFGCTSARVFQTAGQETPVAHVSNVEVRLDPAFQASRSYLSVSMSGTIRHALLKELRRRGKMEPTGLFWNSS